MTVAADAPAQAARETRAASLFRACGVAPVGAFVLLHALGYAQVLFGRRSFGDPDARGPSALELVAEVALVLAPLAYHAAYGVFLLLRRPRAADRSRAPLDRLQRFASVLVLIYIVDHFVRFRWPMLLGTSSEYDAHPLLVRELSSTTYGMPLVAAFQLLGTAAVAFHLGYGVHRHDFAGVRWLSLGKGRTALAVAIGLLVLVPASFALIALATGKNPPFL